MTRFLASAFTLALFVLSVAVAIAAPDRTQALSAEAPSFAWDGPVTPFSLSPAPSQSTCTKPAPGRFCDETLLEVKAPGTLEVVIDEWTADSDLDLFLLTSDAEGTFGEEVTSGLNEGPGPEKVTAKVQPGFYLVFVNYFQAVNSGYKGKATLRATVPAAPAPAPATPGAPAPAPPGPSGDPAALPASGRLAVDVGLTGRSLRKPAATVACTVVCRATLRLSVDARTARKLKLGRKATVIGKATATVRSKQPPAIALRLTAKAKKRLRRARSLKVTLNARVTDGSGGQRTSVKVKAALRR